MKPHLLSFLALAVGLACGGAVPCHGSEPGGPPQTFAIETYARRAYNYLDTMVDKDGLPYFNVFWCDPAEAAHDWPDFGDVMSRQLQAAIMARHLTGKKVKHEQLWMSKVLSYIDPRTGLLVRPRTSFSEPVSDLGDQSLTLYALSTAYADHPTPALKDTIDKMVSHLPALYEAGHWLNGFGIKSLMTWVRLTGSQPALDQAGKLVHAVFIDKPLFTPDNTFRHGGHMHGNLRTLVGSADYALYAKDPVIFSRVDALYRYVRSEGTRFGFLPEVIGRKGDVISCETCALMDFLGLAVTLANHGHPEYWGDVERMVRNQLVESQVTDGSWLKAGNMPDTDQFTWREVGARMVGGYAGWTSPTQILAAREQLQWGGPNLRGKTRAFQNCCGGSGTHALFIVWKNASRFDHGTLSVNLHIDKLLPEAEIRCHQPYRGLLTIDLKRPANVRVRIPDFLGAETMKARANGVEIKSHVWGNYLELGERPANEKLELTYPVVLREEEATIGNPGFRRYRYRVTWKGDTVMRMTPLEGPVRSGYSDFDKQTVELFYGKEGPGSLYQREHLLDALEPKPTPLQGDDGALDFWNLPSPPGVTRATRSYSTRFRLDEDPISEGKKWINGRGEGVDWYDVITKNGVAFGEVSKGAYTDPTALLTGSWGKNQTVTATVFSRNPTEKYYQEVEIRLRSSLTPHHCTGYEVFWRCLKTPNAYAEIVRWNGKVGDWTSLQKHIGAQYGVKNGDQVKATIAGNVIKGYINGVEVISATDSTYSDGNPGMGFNYGVEQSNGDFGFSSYAVDSSPE